MYAIYSVCFQCNDRQQVIFVQQTVITLQNRCIPYLKTKSMAGPSYIHFIYCTSVFRIRIRIRIHWIHTFLDLPDPDPLVRGVDPDPPPDPDPSIILLSSSKNSKKNLDSYCFVTSFGRFIFEKLCKCTLKNLKAEFFFKLVFFWRLEGQ